MRIFKCFENGKIDSIKSRILKYLGYNISFKKSSIIDEFIGFPLHLPISKHHLSSQSNCMKAWADFGKGLIPGSYAPDVEGVTRTGDVKSK